MTRKSAKRFQPTIPTQFKHLRFLDSETGDILAGGGYTLAYRIVRNPVSARMVESLTVRYAFSECSLLDNFNKAEGRLRSYHRLNAAAEDFSGEFELTESELGEGFESKLMQLADGYVDVSGKEFNVAEAVIRTFVAEWGDSLYLEFDSETLADNLVEYRNGLAIDSDVLNMLNADDLDPESILEDMCGMLETVDTAIEELNRPIDLANAAQVNQLHDSLRAHLHVLRETLVGNGADTIGEESASDDEHENEEGR